MVVPVTSRSKMTVSLLLLISISIGGGSGTQHSFFRFVIALTRIDTIEQEQDYSF